MLIGPHSGDLPRSGGEAGNSGGQRRQTSGPAPVTVSPTESAASGTAVVSGADAASLASGRGAFASDAGRRSAPNNVRSGGSSRSTSGNTSGNTSNMVSRNNSVNLMGNRHALLPTRNSTESISTIRQYQAWPSSVPVSVPGSGSVGSASHGVHVVDGTVLTSSTAPGSSGMPDSGGSQRAASGASPQGSSSQDPNSSVGSNNVAIATPPSDPLQFQLQPGTGTMLARLHVPGRGSSGDIGGGVGVVTTVRSSSSSLGTRGSTNSAAGRGTPSGSRTSSVLGYGLGLPPRGGGGGSVPSSYGSSAGVSSAGTSPAGALLAELEGVAAAAAAWRHQPGQGQQRPFWGSARPPPTTAALAAGESSTSGMSPNAAARAAAVARALKPFEVGSVSGGTASLSKSSGSPGPSSGPLKATAATTNLASASPSAAAELATTLENPSATATAASSPLASTMNVAAAAAAAPFPPSATMPATATATRPAVAASSAAQQIQALKDRRGGSTKPPSPQQ